MIPILENSLEIFSCTFGEILSASHHGQHVVQVTVYETRRQILTPIVQDLNMVPINFLNSVLPPSPIFRTD